MPAFDRSGRKITSWRRRLPERQERLQRAWHPRRGRQGPRPERREQQLQERGRQGQRPERRGQQLQEREQQGQRQEPSERVLLPFCRKRSGSRQRERQRGASFSSLTFLSKKTRQQKTQQKTAVRQQHQQQSLNVSKNDWLTGLEPASRELYQHEALPVRPAGRFRGGRRCRIRDRASWR